MYMLVIQLLKQEFKEDLFMALSSAGVTVTTYCDGHNLDNELRNNMPLFSGLFKSQEEKRYYSTLYFCVAESIEQADAVVSGFEIAGIDWRKDRIFQMSVLPIEKFYQPETDE